MHRDWCGKTCGECQTSCALDESMPCSPDCEALAEDGWMIDYRHCLEAGCDVIQIEEIKIPVPDAERWVRLMKNPHSVDLNAEGITPCSTPVKWTATFDDGNFATISIRAGRNFLYLERILWVPFNGTPIEEFVPDDQGDDVLGDHVFAPVEGRVSYVVRIS